MSNPRSATEVEAANGGLAHAGQPPIARLDESNGRAKIVRGRFADVRDAVLREHAWNFAAATATPGQSGTGYGALLNRFPLPADCIAVRAVDDAALGRLEEDSWSIVAGAGINLLAVAGAAPTLWYTRRVEEPALWDALFLAVFQLRLGAVIARSALVRNGALGDRLAAEADEKINTAKLADARESAPTRISRATSWIGARRTGLGGAPWRR